VIRFFAHPLAPLMLFAVVLTVLLTIYFSVGLAPSTTFELLASFSWSLLVAFWVVVDARRRACTPCFDFGLFCYVFYPVAVPWYCFWFRGWRGAVTLLIILGLWIARHIVASMAWNAPSG
jgi:hypothetical protein